MQLALRGKKFGTSEKLKSGPYDLKGNSTSEVAGRNRPDHIVFKGNGELLKQKRNIIRVALFKVLSG